MKRAAKYLALAAALILALSILGCVAIKPPDGRFALLVINHASPEQYTGPNGESALETVEAAFGVECPADFEGDSRHWVVLKLEKNGDTSVSVFGVEKKGTRVFDGEKDIVTITFEDGETLELDYIRSTYMLEYASEAAGLIFSSSDE